MYPLGSDIAIFEYWHVPANTIGLRLLSRIYNEGLIITDKNELTELINEIKLIKLFWNERNMNLIDELEQRARYLIEGIEMTIRVNGKLSIS